MSLHPDLGYGASSLVLRHMLERGTIKPAMSMPTPRRTECPVCGRLSAVEERPIDVWSADEGQWYHVVQKRCYRADVIPTATGCIPTCGAVTVISREPFAAPPPTITRGANAMPTGQPVNAQTKKAILSHVREGMMPRDAIQAESASEQVSLTTVINWCRYEGIQIPRATVQTMTQEPRKPTQEPRGEVIAPSKVTQEVWPLENPSEAILEAMGAEPVIVPPAPLIEPAAVYPIAVAVNDLQGLTRREWRLLPQAVRTAIETLEEHVLGAEVGA